MTVRLTIHRRGWFSRPIYLYAQNTDKGMAKAETISVEGLKFRIPGGGGGWVVPAREITHIEVE